MHVLSVENVMSRKAKQHFSQKIRHMTNEEPDLRSLETAVIWLVVISPIRNQAEGLENRNKSINILFGIPLIVSTALLSFAHGANYVADLPPKAGHLRQNECCAVGMHLKARQYQPEYLDRSIKSAKRCGGKFFADKFALDRSQYACPLGYQTRVRRLFCQV